ncbi:hypothetical protein ACLKA7_005568, partial [Drosophila subpalustris]
TRSSADHETREAVEPQGRISEDDDEDEHTTSIQPS